MILAELRSPVAVMAIVVALLMVYPGDNPAYGQAGGSEARDLFARDKVLEVELEMAEADWNLLRSEGRNLTDIFSGCFSPDYTYTRFPAGVSIGGERVSDVAVRKKGFLGSLSDRRPSLKLDFGRDDHDGRTFHGTRRLTLNNNRQDLTNAKQCVAYELFASAGIPVPRCGLAHVSVDDVDKGFFTNVEPIKKRFLRRVFGNDEGNLYELVVADFTAEREGAFELKTNNDENDRSDLDRVKRALEAPDDQFAEALGEVFDFDEFITFWAMEVLTGHWDGMTGNRNNTFIYHDPADDRFHAIPWGTDGAFGPHLLIPNVPESVYAFNTLSARLYAIPQTRRIFQTRLRTLLDEVWDEERIIARFRSIVEQTDGSARSLATVEEFVRRRRVVIEEELDGNDGNGPEIATGRPLGSGCREPLRASGVIDFTWNDVPTAFRPVEDLDALELQIPLPNGAVGFVPGQVAQIATINAEGNAQFVVVGQDPARDGSVIVSISMPLDNYRAGEVSFHGVETLGVVLQIGPEGRETLLGFIGEGMVTLSEVGRKNGDPVRVHWEGFLAPFGAPPPP